MTTGKRLHNKVSKPPRQRSIDGHKNLHPEAILQATPTDGHIDAQLPGYASLRVTK
jgi:hypothetical protein